MKLNFGLLGIALAQSGDYVDDSSERHDYSYDYNVGHHHHNHHNQFGHDHHYSFNNHYSFGGKAFASDTKHVQAERLSCWNSNSLRDMNHDGKFFDHTSDKYHHYNHQYGFENEYYHQGSHVSGALQDFGDNVAPSRLIDVDDPNHSVTAVDPQKWGYQSDNRDAKYHYGHHLHDKDVGTNLNRPHHHQIASDKASFDGVVDDWRYSLRHAGCLYEVPDYFYGATTFNTKRFLSYSDDEHDYPSTTVNLNSSGTNTRVHWVHVFNAHIHISDRTQDEFDPAGTNGGTGFNGYCDNAIDNPITKNTCFDGDNIHTFAVVMANPTYEGLGFLNFVATYHDVFNPETSDGYSGHRFKSNYDKSALYENSGYWHLSSIGTVMGSSPTWHLPCDKNGCATTNWTSDNNLLHKGLAISSFPHNQLGKDFRFNIRTLHQMGDGYYRATLRDNASSTNIAYSYFFYAISTIQITFPEYVGHVNDCWRQRNSGKCTSDMVHQIIVDQSSVQTTSKSPQNKLGDIAYGNHQFTATLTDSDQADFYHRCVDGSDITDGFYKFNNCASWCKNSGQYLNGHNSNTQTTITNHAGNTNNFCGDTLTISGMLQTYDELHLRQYGTIQEIWVQLMYAYSHPTLIETKSVEVPNADGDLEATDKEVVTQGFESPFPNVFFSAPQVLAVKASCTDTTYGKCNGYTRIQNVPYAGAVLDSARWNEDVDGKNSHRGDAFWVDDHDV
jgi:hypothetical protein